MKKALYIPGYEDVDASDEAALRKCLGINWTVDVMQYHKNEPNIAVGQIAARAMYYDLLIGCRLGGFAVLAAQCSTPKIVVNPCWDVVAELNKYGKNTVHAYKWLAYQDWIDGKNVELLALQENGVTEEDAEIWKRKFGDRAEILEGGEYISDAAAPKISEAVESMED